MSDKLFNLILTTVLAIIIATVGVVCKNSINKHVDQQFKYYHEDLINDQVELWDFVYEVKNCPTVEDVKDLRDTLLDKLCCIDPEEDL